MFVYQTLLGILLSTVDSFKSRKAYESKYGNITWCRTVKSCLARLIKNKISTMIRNLLIHNHNTDEKTKFHRQLIRIVYVKKLAKGRN